jgi:Sec-independent protein translocase protein TatA
MWGKGLVVGLVLAALALFAAALALGVRGIVGLSRTHFIPGVGERRWSNQHNSLTFALAVTVLTALIWPYVVDDVLKNGMPTPLFGGANQWISSIIDALSIIMVVLLVVRGQRKLHDNAEWVGREFGLKMKRKKLIEWHQNRRRERRQEEEKEKAGKSAAVPDATAKPGAETRPWELPKWLVWFWFPLRALPRRSGILFAKDDVSELEAVIAQYLYHGTASARVRRVLPVTLIVVLFLVVPLEEIPGIAHLGRSFDLLSFFSLIAMQFLIFWAADALLLSRSFILALKRDQPAWPPTADTLGLPPQEATQWLDLRLVAARTRGVSGLVWYPSFVIAVMTVAALTIQFREFQFANNPIALAVGTLVVIASAVALRGAAEALRKAVKRCLENERGSMVYAKELLRPIRSNPSCARCWCRRQPTGRRSGSNICTSDPEILPRGSRANEGITSVAQRVNVGQAKAGSPGGCSGSLRPFARGRRPPPLTQYYQTQMDLNR